MTVKRILSVVLSVMMIMASLVCVSAVSAAEITDVDTNVYTVTVSVDVSSEIDGTMTAQILNTEKSELFAIGFDDKEDGSYVFELTMPTYADTGYYVVRIGGNVGAVEYEFHYANVLSLVTFYNNFIAKQADAEDLQDYLEDCSDAPVNLDGYNDLLDAVRTVATKALATVEGLAEVDLESDTVADTVLANNAIFAESFANVMEVAAVIDVDTAEEMQAVIDDEENSFEVYGGFDDLLVEVTAEDVYSYYMEEVESVDTVEEFTVENFALLFDRATLLCIENTKDVDYLKDAFLYYEDKGSIDVTMTNINKLITKKTDGELWKKLYGKTNTDIETLVSNAESIAKDLANGGGEGSSGGADRDDSTDLPTTPATPGAAISKPTATVTFMDLGSAEWAREAVEALAAKGVLNGKEAGRFAPNDNVTREEITKIITSAFDLVQKDAECEFADVDADRWSYVYVASASRLGIVNGYGADFGPANKTTREDMAVMIYRVLKLLGIEVSGSAQNFSDSADISDYAKEAVNALTSAGIINGMGDGTFAPKAYVTRAQIAKVAYELLNLAGGNQ